MKNTRNTKSARVLSQDPKNNNDKRAVTAAVNKE